MEITVKTEITTQAIADLMVSAIEGNHMTRAWCNGIKPTGRTIKFAEELEKKNKARWYSIADFYNGGFELMVEEIDDESTGHITKHRINAGTLKAGLERMAKEQPEHYADFLSENYDIITADVFLQCVVLKDLIYG